MQALLWIQNVGCIVQRRLSLFYEAVIHLEYGTYGGGVPQEPSAPSNTHGRFAYTSADIVDPLVLR